MGARPAAILLTVIALTGSVAATATARPNVAYPNCKALNRHYPHGVGRWGARDHTSGTPVTNFKRSNRLYWQNKARAATRTGSPARSDRHVRKSHLVEPERTLYARRRAGSWEASYARGCSARRPARSVVSWRS
jgi:hypothetical protein